jgi:hypothetical protein
LRYKYLPIFFNKHPTIHALTCHDLRPKKPTGSDSVSLEEVSSSRAEASPKTYPEETSWDQQFSQDERLEKDLRNCFLHGKSFFK